MMRKGSECPTGKERFKEKVSDGGCSSMVECLPSISYVKPTERLLLLLRVIIKCGFLRKIDVFKYYTWK